MNKYQKLTSELFEELQSLNLGFHPNLRGRINDWSIELGIIRQEDSENLFHPAFASEIFIYPRISTILGEQKASISHGSSGEYSPENQSAYWRTKHAMIVLENWETIMDIAKKYCGKVEEIKKQS